MWLQYRNKARQLTKLQPVHLLENSDKPKVTRHHQLYSYDHFVIDHKISIWYGFHNGIPVEDIANISNLRWIPSKENCLKGIKSVF